MEKAAEARAAALQREAEAQVASAAALQAEAEAQAVTAAMAAATTVPPLEAERAPSEESISTEESIPVEEIPEKEWVVL